MERHWMYAVIGTLACAASAFAFGQSQDTPASSFEALYARESKENARDTIDAYISAARSGSCQAAKRLGEIYDRGLIGVGRDYAEGIKWSRAADTLGCTIARAEPARNPPASKPAPTSANFHKAAALDADGKGAQAVDAYERAARAGSCEAAQRLGEIYDQGLIGVTRNYAESLKWYNAARILGCDIAMPARK